MSLSAIEQALLKGDISYDFKISSKDYNDVINKRKTFELCKDDKSYKVGDVFVFREFENGQYTGRYFIQSMGYILRNCPQDGLINGYCIFGW